MHNNLPIEKRIFTRKPFRTEIIFEDEFGDGLFYVHSEDVSMSGIHLATNIPIRIGSFIFASFTLPPHKRPVKVCAEVVRYSNIDGKRHGMGVQFIGLSDIAKKRLTEFFESY